MNVEFLYSKRIANLIDCWSSQTYLPKVDGIKYQA